MIADCGLRIADWMRITASALVVLGYVHPMLAESAAKFQSEIRNPKSEISTPFLWKVTSPTATAPSYIFGTIHLPRPDVARIPASVAPAFDSADAVYTEIPMDTGTLLSMSAAMFLPDGKKLEDVLPADLYATVLQELTAINPRLPLAPRDRLKIWAFTVSLMTLEDELKHAGVIPLDMLLFQKAAMAGKETGGLETPAEQMAIFDDISEADQITLLRDTLTQLKTARESGINVADQLVASYLSGDLARLEADMKEMEALAGDSELNDRLMDRLLDQRNELMAERIEAKIKADPAKTYFFAMGAAHLYGETGLIALLEAAGFTLTRQAANN